MPVCSYYQRGTCRFGEQCKNEHPGSQRDTNRNSGGGAFGGGSNNNRFGGFNGDRYRPNQASGTFTNNRDPKTLPYHLDPADMKNDLTGQRPIYPLSCYGPGRDAPRQLIEGPVEISPEELRVRYYAQRLAGNEPGAQQEESALNEKMQQQVQSILSDIDGAVRYIEEGANVHPNRIDLANGTAPAPTSTSSSNPFSQAPAPAPANTASQTTANPFLKAPTAPTSAFGQTSTPAFGRPAFGQASAPAQSTSAFGQASNPNSTTSAFGQPSNPGQAAPGFGTASNLGPKPSPFSQASATGAGGAFGKPAFGASGFGQASMPGSGSALGQTSSLGQKPAFGSASAPGAASPFGQPSAIGQQASPFNKPAFGQTGFGQSSQPGPGASPFSQAAQSGASPFGQQPAAQVSPFGQQPTSQASPFGQQPAAQTTLFGANLSKPADQRPDAFLTKDPPRTSVFGQPNQPASGSSPFGTQQAQQTSTPASNPFLQKPQGLASTPAAAAPSPFGGTQSTSPFAQAAAQQQGAPTTQQAQPAAATGAAKEIDPKDRFKEGKPEEYAGDQGRILEEIYRRVGQLGRFNDDEDIPLVPPKCEWIVPVPLL